MGQRSLIHHGEEGDEGFVLLPDFKRGGVRRSLMLEVQKVPHGGLLALVGAFASEVFEQAGNESPVPRQNRRSLRAGQWDAAGGFPLHDRAFGSARVSRFLLGRVAG